VTAGVNFGSDFATNSSKFFKLNMPRSSAATVVVAPIAVTDSLSMLLRPWPLRAMRYNCGWHQGRVRAHSLREAIANNPFKIIILIMI
jgi:hypothetical protein